MTDEQKALLRDNNVNIDDAITRFNENEKLYLEYFLSFPNENTYKSFRDSFKVDKLWQSQNILVTFIGIVGNLGFTKLYDDSCHLLKSVKSSNVSEAVLALEKLDNDYTEMLNFIRNVGI